MAGKQHRSKSWLINEALRSYIQRQEQDQARWQETLQAMESVAQGKAVPAEVVHAWLRSWGSAEEQPAPKISE
jgi:predicted transcriptional regulator